MAEIRIVCPGCAAEYRLDGAAIPARGREVECSACGRIWHQSPPPPDPAPRDRLSELTERAHAVREGTAPRGPVRTIPVPPQAPSTPVGSLATPPDAEGGPRLHRPLPPDVLAILTEEAARERSLRAGAGEPPPETAPREDVAPDAMPDPDWPATTIVTPPEPAAPMASPASPPAASSEAAPSRAAPTADPAPSRAAVPAEPPRLTPRAVPVPTPYHAPAPGPRRSGAFWWGLAIPALMLALYLLSGAFPPGHPVAETLAPLRAALDGARLWLAGLIA